MNVQTVLHMVGGQGNTSYAMNSHLQEMVLSKANRIVQDAVMELYIKTLPKCFTIADLGCSSGPNSLQVISKIMDTIVSTSHKIGHITPEIQVFLNDLHGNDFNTIFKSIPYFIEKFKKDKGDELAQFFISGMPGSFFGRLFPMESLNFVHSSYSLHFLSQVPVGIENNKGNIYIAKTSPSSVLKAYFDQYQRDFTLFLRSRSKEIVHGGRMVITQIGRRSSDPTSKECCDLWDLLTLSLLDMVYEGCLEEAKLDSFNWPAYFPSEKEVKNIIEEEGSFRVDLLQTFDVSWEQNVGDLNKDDVYTTGQYMSKIIRAVAEPLLVNHFGEEIIEDLFHKFTEHVNVHIVKEKSHFVNVVMCMTRKE